MTLHEKIGSLIAETHPSSIAINRKMYRELLKELSSIQGSFEGVFVKIDGVGIYTVSSLEDGFIQVRNRRVADEIISKSP